MITIPHDKAMHAIFGALAGLAGAVAAHVAAQPLWAGALIAAALVGAIKELRDAAGYGTPDAMDFVATVLGAAPLALATLL